MVRQEGKDGCCILPFIERVSDGSRGEAVHGGGALALRRGQQGKLTRHRRFKVARSNRRQVSLQHEVAERFRKRVAEVGGGVVVLLLGNERTQLRQRARPQQAQLRGFHGHPGDQPGKPTAQPWLVPGEPFNQADRFKGGRGGAVVGFPRHCQRSPEHPPPHLRSVRTVDLGREGVDSGSAGDPGANQRRRPFGFQPGGHQAQPLVFACSRGPVVRYRCGPPGRVHVERDHSGDGCQLQQPGELTRVHPETLGKPAQLADTDTASAQGGHRRAADNVDEFGDEAQGFGDAAVCGVVAYAHSDGGGNDCGRCKTQLRHNDVAARSLANWAG